MNSREEIRETEQKRKSKERVTENDFWLWSGYLMAQFTDIEKRREIIHSGLLWCFSLKGKTFETRQCPSIWKIITKLWYIHIIKYNSAIKRNKNTDICKNMNDSVNNILSRSQTQKNTYFITFVLTSRISRNIPKR